MTGAIRMPAPIWFAGCGNMGGAIVEGWRSAGIDLSSVVAIRPSGTPVEGVRTVKSFAEAGPPPKLIVLGFKPQKLDEVAGQLKTWLTSKTIVVSLLAGVEVKSLRERFPSDGSIVRLLPNLPVSVRRGVIGFYGEDVSDDARQQVSDLFGILGYGMWMADEEKLAVLGSVAGAGPAYVARFVAALAKAGETRGLSAETATTIALETVLGTAWMAAASNESMADLAKRVASPKGTTEAGLAVLDHDHVLDQLVNVTIDAAGRRGAELAREARGASLAEDASLS